MGLPSSAVGTLDDSSRRNEWLWASIDHAERCLVSAMYKEAVEVASSTLRLLYGEIREEVDSQPLVQNGPPREGDECSELVSMVEAAGMVLLQALNLMGRSCSIFEELITIFECVGNVPYSLVLTGTCLQLPMGFQSRSQAALEEYLSGWRPIESSTDSFMMRAAQVSSDNQMNDGCTTEGNERERACRWLYLSRTNYLQLTEIYVIEVLAKVHRNSGAAHLWIKSSSISEEEKQAFSAKLQLVSLSHKSSPSYSAKVNIDKLYETTPSAVSEPAQSTGEEMRKEGSLEEKAPSRIGALPVSDDHPSTISEESGSRVVVKGSGIWQIPFKRSLLRLLELVMIRLTHSQPLQRIGLVRGALMSVIMYALYRKRLFWTRWTMELVTLANVCFSDLWQMAFSVHLNPLATV